MMRLKVKKSLSMKFDSNKLKAAMSRLVYSLTIGNRWLGVRVDQY
jgi:hypothetical protein